MIVIDPGHGGTTKVGGSSPNNATGPAGTLEKNLTLIVASQVRDALIDCTDNVELTRYDDSNLGLADRAHVARDNNAQVFVSIHLNGFHDASVNGTETFVHTSGSAASAALADSVQRATQAATGARDRGVKRMNLGVLDPSQHAADTAACLVEVSFLTNAGEEARLLTSAYQEKVARAIAGGIADYLGVSCVAPFVEAQSQVTRGLRTRDETFDIWHEVPLVPQLTGMSCWAAAAAMIIGWRDCLVIDPEEVARASGRWSDYRDGMHPHDIDSFARAWGLSVEAAGTLTVARLRELLERNGPLWVGEASAGLHVIVVAGAFGDGTRDGTFVRVLDPWPAGRGERYTLTAAELLDSLYATVEMSGVQPRVLHAGGLARGASRSAFRVREEASSYVRFDRPAHEEGYAQPRFGTPYGVLHRYSPAYRNQATAPAGARRAVALAGAATLDPAEETATTGEIDDKDWYTDADLSGEARGQALLVASDAAWADDRMSPDFRHLQHAGSTWEFELSGTQLHELFLLNGFDITAGQDEVLFGLRGCARGGPASAYGQFADAVMLTEDLPDHVGYHCVLGVYRRSTGQLAVFPGSTVPNWSLMERQRTGGAQAQIANLLPTGCYTYHVGRHRAVNGAFVLQPDVVVLRSRDNLVFEVTDVWQRHSPGDNIHPGFSAQGALFSSAGCQTVPGRWTEKSGHEGTWAAFRAAAGLSSDNNSGWGRAYVYCLLTGRDARLMGEVSTGAELARLRFGSRGSAVRSLQQALTREGIFNSAIDGRVDASTSLALVQWQQGRDAGAADAIVTPQLAADFGFDLL